MEKPFCLAVDIGASSGRVMLGSLDHGFIVSEELHRFPNGAELKNGHLTWDVERMLCEIKKGMKKCADLGIRPLSIGIDCFGVDFVLLDEKGDMLGDAVAYRDERSRGYREKAELTPQEIFMRSGSLGDWFSSAYQLLYLRDATGLLDSAAHFLQLPDYLNFRLCGEIANELTIAQTSLLVNAESGEFDAELLEKLRLPRRLFGKISRPASILSRVSPQVAAETGLDCLVAQPCEHDTVSAMAAIPGENEDCIFISSGTWSMIGAFLDRPMINEKSAQASYTNMFLTENRTGLVRGITGLWMIQSVRKELGGGWNFEMLREMAEKSNYGVLIDVDDRMFNSPASMIGAVRQYLAEHDLPEAKEIGDILNCIYRSLASKYAENAARLEKLTGRTYDRIYIVGGGSKDSYLNRLTAAFTGKKVYTGSPEATVTGNIAAQFTAHGLFGNLEEAARVLRPPAPVE